MQSRLSNNLLDLIFAIWKLSIHILPYGIFATDVLKKI